VSRVYGVYDEQAGLSARALRVVDEQGVIRWSQTYPDAVNLGVDGILSALEAMGVNTAKPGDQTSGFSIER
jgi:alkyl hydroperoxide reductase subunit AhpC